MLDAAPSDRQECVIEAQHIKGTKKEGVDAPTLFAVGLGDDTVQSQLRELVEAANGSLKFCVDGAEIMDLVQTCEHSKEGANRLQEIFSTQVT